MTQVKRAVVGSLAHPGGGPQSGMSVSLCCRSTFDVWEGDTTPTSGGIIEVWLNYACGPPTRRSPCSAQFLARLLRPPFCFTSKTNSQVEVLIRTGVYPARCQGKKYKKLHRKAWRLVCEKGADAPNAFLILFLTGRLISCLYLTAYHRHISERYALWKTAVKVSLGVQPPLLLPTSCGFIMRWLPWSSWIGVPVFIAFMEGHSCLPSIK